MQERLVAVEVCIVEQLLLGIDRDSGSTPCEARHVGTPEPWEDDSGSEDLAQRMDAHRCRQTEVLRKLCNAVECQGE